MLSSDIHFKPNQPLNQKRVFFLGRHGAWWEKCNSKLHTCEKKIQMCTPRNTYLRSTTAILTLSGSTHHPPYRGGVEGEGATPGKAASLGIYLAASAESGTAVRRRGREGGEGRREDRWGGARPQADRAGSQ